VNKYEIMYIIRGTATESARETAIKKYSTLVEKSGGKVDSVEKMGMKKFAYPIDFKNEGFYVLMNFTAKSSLPAELERQMRISDNIVRFMVVNKEGQHDLQPRRQPVKKDATEKSEKKQEQNLAKTEESADKLDATVSQPSESKLTKEQSTKTEKVITTDNTSEQPQTDKDKNTEVLKG